jgi:hypothetical protein
LNAERLSLMRQQDQMRADLARQFGRKEAIDQLHRDAADQARKDRQRRADRSG